MKKINLILLYIITGLFVGCGGSDDPPMETPDDTIDDVGTVDDDMGVEEFDLPMLLADVTNSLILATITDFNDEASTFKNAVDTYLSEPNEVNFEALRAQWIVTTLAYEKTYVFHIGVARDRFLDRAIYNWPTVASAIEEFIANNEVTEETIAPLSPQIKALAGIEYLLFKGDVASTNQEFLDDEKRREYLRLSIDFLVFQADRLLAIWSSEGEDYATTFINSEDTGVRASFNLFFNGLNNAVDVAKVTKIGKPGGLETSDIPNPDIVQAPFSNISLDLLSVSVEMVEAAFFADDITNVSDYIFFILQENSLNDDLQAKIDEVQAAIDAITISLELAVTDNTAEVENLHTKLTELGILLTVDARSVLSIIITSTDNDGD
ncbi:MAG: imelysin family protein [Bacteroidota bacterium]